jgi:hypothetical protein
MKPRVGCAAFALAISSIDPAVAAAQAPADKPAAPLVAAVGCAQRSPQGVWTLANAADMGETRVLFLTAKEMEAARTLSLGQGRYVLVGTADFVTKEELLKSGQRAEFTRPEIANATGQLQQGRKLLVKGLLTASANERRLNLVAVQQLAETCK